MRWIETTSQMQKMEAEFYTRLVLAMIMTSTIRSVIVLFGHEFILLSPFFSPHTVTFSLFALRFVSTGLIPEICI